jgi:hypothetical protein
MFLIYVKVIYYVLKKQITAGTTSMGIIVGLD